MSAPWCGACGAGTVRNGTRPVRYRDLEDGRGVEREARVQRMACKRCDAVLYAGTPVLAPGFRVTPALSGAVSSACLSSGFSDVAARFGLDAGTVGALWAAEVGALSSSAPHPRLALLSGTDIGARTVSVARDGLSGDFAGAWPGPSDPGLAAWLRRHPGGVLAADWRHLEAAARAAPASLDVVCDRASVAAWFSASLRGVAARARGWMDPRERRALRAAWACVAAEEAERSPEEDKALDGVCARFPLIGELRAGTDGFRAAWRIRDPARARAALDTWRRELSAFGRDAFSAAARMADRVSRWAFGPRWAEAFAAGDLGPPAFPVTAAPRDTAERAAGKALVAGRRGPCPAPVPGRRAGAFRADPSRAAAENPGYGPSGAPPRSVPAKADFAGALLSALAREAGTAAEAEPPQARRRVAEAPGAYGFR